MPAKSKSQQRFMGMVHALQKGELSPSDVSDKVKDTADQMSDSDAEDYASTKHTGKPEKVAKEVVRKLREMIRQMVKENPTFLLKKEVAKRDYKAEYKKFQSSDKAKKYRAELNQYNRKKGTYGNGDGKDASHKGGKIVGFETQSKNRGRAEKSRLPKEGFGSKDTISLKKRKEFEQWRKDNAEQLGYTLSGVSDIKSESTKSWNKSLEKIAKDRQLKSLSKKDRNTLMKIAKIMKRANESINEAGMGVLTSDQSDILQGIVLKYKNKNTRAILNIALKSGYFKRVDKKELLGYIDGARQFVRYMKSHPSVESVKENLGKRCTVKEISKWLKTLEEFRYRKVRGVDARRVASFVNNGMNEEELPISLQKKWEHKKYGREKHLAGKFIETFLKQESVNEAVEQHVNFKKFIYFEKNKQAKKIGGTLVDLTTASMMTQVWDKVNDSSKEKMNKMNTKQLIRLILKLWDRMGTPRV